MDISAVNLKTKFFNLWRSSEKTGQQVVRGSLLIFTERVFIKLLYFVRTVILARLLFPADFGLFGMAMLAMNIPSIFTNPALQSAVVQKKDLTKAELDSAWTLYLVRNLALAVILFFGAPLAGAFFHNSEVVPFVRALSLYYVIAGLESFGTILLQKEMKYNRLFVFYILPVIGEVLVSLVSAFILRNAWALLLGMLANNIITTIISYFINPWRPALNFRFENVRYLLRFGKWIGLGGILTFFVSQGDHLAIGRLLDTSALGFYAIAFALGTLPAVEIARALGNILFSLYSKLQADLVKLKSAFLEIASVVFSLTIPAAAGLLVLSDDIIKIIYGERWLPMASALYILIFLGLVRSLDFLLNPLLLGIGRARASVYVQGVQAVIMFGLMILLTPPLGIAGTALSVLAGALVSQLNLLFILRRQFGLLFKELFKSVLLPAVASAAMMALIFSLKKILPVNGALALIFFVFFGIVIYAAGLFSLDYLFRRKFYHSLVWIKKNL